MGKAMADSKRHKQSAQFRFRKHDRIGAASAEEDEYLPQCFVDTGELVLLEDRDDRRVIVVGRTGAGKSAILSRIRERHSHHALEIAPETLALTHVSNSPVLRFFSDVGVTLDPFFKLLWRHILAVELLTKFFDRHPVPRSLGLIDNIRNMFPGDNRRDKQMKEALQYLEQWGKSFWLETEFRVKEITQTFERQLEAQATATLGTKTAGASLSGGGAQKLTEETKAELLRRGQEVVASAQVQDLHNVMKMLGEVLSSRSEQYFIMIDKLDENWVEESLQYKLIMALIHVARDFHKIQNAKVIIALRRDLMERVFRLQRPSGFQEEKYQSMCLTLKWEESQLIELLDRRINALVAPRYTRQPLSHRDLLPKSSNKTPITDYLTQRVTRPRDIIAFFNSCIDAGTNLQRLTMKELRMAEGEYSRSRLKAIADEWSADYPRLLDFAEVLRQRPASFKLSTIEDRDIEEMCLRLLIVDPAAKGILESSASRLIDCEITTEDFKVLLAQTFYKVALVALKVEPHEQAFWASDSGRSISAGEIDRDTSLVVHPMFYRVLGTKQVDF
jgi:hypothetical protein